VTFASVGAGARGARLDNEIVLADGHPDVRAAADVVVSRCADGGVADLVDRLLSEASAPIDLAAGT
jgi:hypothetical protein